MPQLVDQHREEATPVNTAISTPWKPAFQAKRAERSADQWIRTGIGPRANLNIRGVQAHRREAHAWGPIGCSAGRWIPSADGTSIPWRSGGVDPAPPRGPTPRPRPGGVAPGLPRGELGRRRFGVSGGGQPPPNQYVVVVCYRPPPPPPPRPHHPQAQHTVPGRPHWNSMGRGTHWHINKNNRPPRTHHTGRGVTRLKKEKGPRLSTLSQPWSRCGTNNEGREKWPRRGGGMREKKPPPPTWGAQTRVRRLLEGGGGEAVWQVWVWGSGLWARRGTPVWEGSSEVDLGFMRVLPVRPSG